MDRIELLASLCKGANTVLDVGCDHAYVLVKALTTYGIKRGIASDINEGPLNTAIENIKNKCLTDRVDFVLSDGFKNVNLEFDTAVIAGMGGNLIKSILEDASYKIKGKKLILEANNDSAIVRLFLMNNNFQIIDEFAIYDNNKYYEIIVAKEGISNYSNEELKYGPILLKKKPLAFIKFYNKKIDLLNNIISKTSDLKTKEEKEIEKNEILSFLN